MRASRHLAAITCAMPAFAGALSHAAPKEATAVRAATAPEIDGRLTEACWQRARPLTGFKSLRTDKPPAAPPEVRFAFDDAYLYVAARCPEGRVVTPYTSRQLPRDSGNIFHAPNIEILLDTDADGKTHRKFVFDASGNVYDATVTHDARSDAIGRDPSWNADVLAATRGSDPKRRFPDSQRSWTLEAAIPPAMLHEGRPIKRTWRINVGKAGPNAGQDPTHQAVWSKAKQFFDETARFGVLKGFDVDFARFGNVSLSLALPKRLFRGKNTVPIELRLKRKLAEPVRLMLTTRSPSGGLADRVWVGRPTPPGTKVLLPVTFDEPGRYVLEARAGALAFAKQSVVMPSLLEIRAENPRYGPYLFPDMDQKEVVLGVRTAIPPARLRSYAVVIRFLTEAGAELHARRISPLPEAHFEVGIPVEPARLRGLSPEQSKAPRLPLGTYTYDVALLGPDGVSVAHKTMPLRVLGTNPFGGSTVRIDQRNNLVIDGKATFAIGMYWASDKKIRDLGFNFCCHWATSRTLEGHIVGALRGAQRSGLFGIAGPNHYDWDNWRLPLDQASLDFLRKRVQTLSRVPSYAICEIEDEPGFSSSRLDRLEAATPHIKRFDPYHPVAICEYVLSAYPRIGRFVDVMICDPYERESVTRVIRDVDLQQKAVERRKPVMAVISHATPGTLSARGVRAQTYAAIVHGVKGVFYFAWFFPNKGGIRSDPPRLKGVKRSAGEMNKLHNVLVAPDAETQPVNRFGGRVHSLLKVYRGQGYLLAVNTTHDATSAAFDLPQMAPGSHVDVMFEGRKIRASGAKLSDSFAPLAVHVYRLPLRQGMYPDNGYVHLRRKDFDLGDVIVSRPGRGWWNMTTTFIDFPGTTYSCVKRGLNPEDIKPFTVELKGLSPGRYYLAIRSRRGREGWLGGGGVSVRDDSAGEKTFKAYPPSGRFWAGVKEIEVPASGRYRLSFGAGKGNTTYGTVRLHRLPARDDVPRPRKTP